MVFSTSNGWVARVARAPAVAAEAEFTAVDSENGTAITVEFGAEDTADAGDASSAMLERVTRTFDKLTHHGFDMLIEDDKDAGVGCVTQG